MRNRLIIALAIVSTITTLHAKPRGVHIVKEKIGQEYYLKACSSCHSEGKIGGNMATQKEWKALLGNRATELIYLHEDVYSDKKKPNATKAIEYLQSDIFKKEHKALLRFLQEFASDSADIPTCY